MKANELRLGNLVAYEPTIDDWEEIIVKCGNIIQCEISPDSFIPIPLTEEWLLKFGFEKVGFQFIKDGIELFPIRDLYYRGNFPIKSDIKYVHQLQNLYFALVGKELKLNII